MNRLSALKYILLYLILSGTLPGTHLYPEKSAETDQKQKQTDSSNSEKKSKNPDQKFIEEQKKAKAEKQRKEALEKIKKDLLYANNENRKIALNRVEKLKKDEQKQYIEIISGMVLNDVDRTIRIESVRTLGSIKATDAKDTLLKALDDEDRDVRHDAVRSLKKIEAKDSATKMATMIKEEDFKNNNVLLEELIRNVGDFEYTEISPFLVEKLNDPTTHIENRRTITLYFGTAKIKSVRDEMVRIMMDKREDMLMREYATNSLGKLGDPTSIPQIKELIRSIDNSKDPELKTRSSRLRLQAVTSLVRLGDATVKEELFNAARDDSSIMRLRAVRFMGELKIMESRELLEYKAEYDPSDKVRKAARKALENMGFRKKDDKNSR